MKLGKNTAFALLASLSLLAGLTAANAADSTVQVKLWDIGADTMAGVTQENGTSKGMAMDHAMASMGNVGVTLDKAEVTAGAVTFSVLNGSSDLVHEMIVASVADTTTPLKYEEDDMKVDEDGVENLGEVADLEPGATGTLTLTLTPGTYIVYCNIPGHYGMGMWTLLTVTA